MSERTIRIGTRGSPLALAQAREVASRLHATHPDLQTERSVIKTTGDRVTDRPLAEIGGKGLFCKEIEAALLDGEIDCAVHSMKDMETHLPDGLIIAAILPREDPRDAFLSEKADGPDTLPDGAVVGTTSLRRQAQLLNRRPDLSVVTFRGNVDTRLAKLAAGDVDATILAMAGLNRLERTGVPATPLEPEVLLPAAAQGAIGIEIRTDDIAMRTTLAQLNHRPSAVCVNAERALLAALDGTCNTPIGALATLAEDGRLRLRGMVAMPDGSRRQDGERVIAVSDAETAALDLGDELRLALGGAFPR